MESPKTTIWGPSLWMILHSAAERIGTQYFKRIPQEESRIWLGLLRSLQFTLPCPQCKKHYSTYLLKHPILSFTKEYIREWLFELHNNVNKDTNKENVITLEQLEKIYSQPIDYKNHMNTINFQMSYAVRIGWSSYEDTVRTRRFFKEMHMFYNLV